MARAYSGLGCRANRSGPEAGFWIGLTDEAASKMTVFVRERRGGRRLGRLLPLNGAVELNMMHAPGRSETVRTDPDAFEYLHELPRFHEVFVRDGDGWQCGRVVGWVTAGATPQCVVALPST